MTRILFGILTALVPAYGDTLDRTNWFDSTGLMTATPGHLEMPLTNDTEQFFTTYFAPTNAPMILSQAGNQIKVTWAFTPSGVQSFDTDSPLAFGIVNTADTNRLTMDGTPGDAPYAGYSAFIGAGYSGLFWIFDLANRADAITPLPLYSGFGGRDNWSIQTGNYNYGATGQNGIPEVFTLTLTRTASNGIGVHSVVTAGSNIINQLSFIDPSPSTFQFNTASVFNDGRASGLFDTTAFQVQFFTNGVASIDSPPNPISCYPGNTITFAAAVDGALPLTCQWSLDGTNLPEATNTTLTLTNVQFDQSGVYVLTASNEFGMDESSNAVLTVNPPLAAVPPPPGLISWWPADGNANDIVGGNNGTLLNSITYGNGQAGGQCFLITSNNAGVDVGAATNLQLQDFTIETWVQRTSTSAASFAGEPGWLFSFGSGGYGFGMNDDGTLILSDGGTDEVLSSNQVSDTGWHHVAVTKSGTNVVFYIDGSDVGEPVFTNAFNFTTSATIGAQTADPGYPLNSFNGAIDEMSIYRRALSPAEIQAIAGAGGGGKTLQLPQIQFSFDGTNILVAWPSWAGNFQLQTSTNGVGPDALWMNVDGSAQPDGLNLESGIPVAGADQFFRLVYPLPGP